MIRQDAAWLGGTGSGAGQDAKEKESWIHDEDVVACPGCDKRFGYTFRKHHCRVCGGVFCDACAPKGAIEINNPGTGKLVKERACGSCVIKDHKEKELARLGNFM